MLRSLIGLAVVAMAATVASADEVTTFTLPNGMQGIVIEDHRAPVVTHMVWYRAGAADEKRGKSGIAHFLEHLMFKGTKEVPDGQFSKLVEANGGYDNAFTTEDQTAYFQRLAADRLDLVMKMEADRMRDLILSDSDVTTERDVILEERSQRIDSQPEALFSEQLDAAQYLNHPYGTPTIGWRSEMERLTGRTRLTGVGALYAPNNATLIVAGDVDPKQVEKLAETYYGPLKPSDGIVERVRPVEPPQLAERRLQFTDPNISQPYVTRSYLAPERNPGDPKKAAALTFLSALLGGNSQFLRCCLAHWCSTRRSPSRPAQATTASRSTRPPSPSTSPPRRASRSATPKRRWTRSSPPSLKRVSTRPSSRALKPSSRLR